MTREEAILLVTNCTINNYDCENLKHAVNKIYDDFENSIDEQISALEDYGWYEYDDKVLCITAFYELKEVL